MSFRVLLVKLSSLGDVVHTYPAVSDAKRARPDVEIDWLVEAPFSELPALHPGIRKVIPAHIKAMKKKSLLDKVTYARALREALKGRYDLVIDAQGLIKSAVAAWLAGAPVAGYSAEHARESRAALAYKYKFDLTVMQNAATRTRKLFAAALGYELEGMPLDHGLDVKGLATQGRTILAKLRINKPPAVFLHGSAWPTKTWDPERWRAVARHLDERGIPLVVPAGSAEELETAIAITEGIEKARVLPPLSLTELAGVLAASRVAAGVDTGLTHLAEAVGKPGVFLIGPTDPVRTGPIGKSLKTLVSSHADAPCYKRTCKLTPGGRCCMDAITEREVLRAIDYALAMT